MTIFIDSRIGSKELYPLISHGIKCELTKLEYGDVAWLGNGPDGVNTYFIGVERKTLNDFLNSMITGRLSGHQIPGMLNCYNKSYIVIEGIWRVGKNNLIENLKFKSNKKFGWSVLTLGGTQFTSSMLDNFINSISCITNIQIIFTNSIERTSDWVSNIYRWWTSKEWHQHKSINLKKIISIPMLPNGEKPSLITRVLVELDGIGQDKAIKISKHIKTIKELSDINLKQLTDIKGIGKITAKNILKQIKGE